MNAAVDGQHFTFFFFNDTATTEIYTLSLHDALPILCAGTGSTSVRSTCSAASRASIASSSSRKPCPTRPRPGSRSEEHTSELQSRQYLVCRLLLEKKKIQFLGRSRVVAIGMHRRGRD